MRLLRAAVVATMLALLTTSAVAGLPTLTLEGRRYVDIGRVAESLETRLDAAPGTTRAVLRAGGHVVTFTRNWAQVLLDGKAVTLDAPVRVKEGVWLVPETFVARVLPTLTTATLPARAAKGPVPVLRDLRFRSYPSFTRVVLETSTALGYRVEQRGAHHVLVRLTALDGAAREEEVRDGFVDGLRLERDAADALLRVAFEGASGELRASTLADPPRLVLDFVRPTEPELRDSRKPVTPLKVIVLDAGHGGHDSGAIGTTGLMEKDVVLDVTRRVAGLLEQRLGVKVLLSRDADYFVPLRDRTSFANRQRADLFVSIHANAHRDAGSQGVEVYFLSSEATDNGARQVAAQENGVVRLEKSGAGPRADIVKTILWDLAQSEFQLESSQLAEIVDNSMGRSLRTAARVKQAGFYVLGGAAMPAILIEIGFLTNPSEERKLRDPEYRAEIAVAIAAALGDYKQHYDQRMRAAAAPAR